MWLQLGAIWRLFLSTAAGCFNSSSVVNCSALSPSLLTAESSFEKKLVTCSSPPAKRTLAVKHWHTAVCWELWPFDSITRTADDKVWHFITLYYWEPFSCLFRIFPPNGTDGRWMLSLRPFDVLCYSDVKVVVAVLCGWYLFLPALCGHWPRRVNVVSPLLIVQCGLTIHYMLLCVWLWYGNS